MNGFLNALKYLFNNDAKCANIISICALILSILMPIVSTKINNKKYKKSLKPILACKLYKKNNYILLKIKNNGKSIASNVGIKFIEIKGNIPNKFEIDSNFKKKFTLYPTEEVQGIIALNNESIGNETSPNIRIEISYNEEYSKKTVIYERDILYKEEMLLENEKDEIAAEIRSIAYSNNRIANYLEGRTLFKFDELNVYPNSSLYKDMKKAFSNNINNEKDDSEE